MENSELDAIDSRWSKSMVDKPEDSFDTDIKINPDYYIHTAIVNMQNALQNPNLRDGFVKYRLYIEHIEVLCRAAEMLLQDYDTQMDEYIKAQNESKIDEFKKEVNIANKKLLLMMQAVFRKKPLTDPMKI